EGMVRTLGGTPVNMSPAESYSALQKGVVDGGTIPVYVSADFKLYEVAKAMTRPTSGSGNAQFMINVRKLDYLPVELKKILLEESRKIVRIGREALDRYSLDDETRMKQNGGKVVEFAPAVTPKLNAMFNEGILATASRSSPDDVKALWELAKSRGLLNQ